MTGITVVLFDIDGTLLDMRGAGRKSFIRALKSVFGWDDDIRYINFAGNTDHNVLQQVMEKHGRTPIDDDRRRFFTQIPVELAQTAGKAELLIHPGVKELLKILSADERVMLGLVTGNVEACARIKLRQFDLHEHFVLGAFGDDHADRSEIARLAIRRAREALTPDREIRARFLVGDTPFDIAAAKSIEAVSIAVATGKFDANALRAAGADHILTDLSDTPRILRLLGLNA
jgi:phosphoglycolate phosphatase-like HAD superfamily hydrolase